MRQRQRMRRKKLANDMLSVAERLLSEGHRDVAKGLDLDRIFIEEGWQDEDRTYTPGERQLDCRIDCQVAPG